MNLLELGVVWLMVIVVTVVLWSRAARRPVGQRSPEIISAAICTFCVIFMGIFLALIALGV